MKNLLVLSFLIFNSVGKSEDIPEAGKDEVAVEVLEFYIKEADVDKWVELDSQIWTSYLKTQDGYIEKVIPKFCHSDVTKLNFKLLKYELYL